MNKRAIDLTRLEIGTGAIRGVMVFGFGSGVLATWDGVLMRKQRKLLRGSKPDDHMTARPSSIVNKGRVYPYAGKRLIGRASRISKEKS